MKPPDAAQPGRGTRATLNNIIWRDDTFDSSADDVAFERLAAEVDELRRFVAALCDVVELEPPARFKLLAAQARFSPVARYVLNRERILGDLRRWNP